MSKEEEGKEVSPIYKEFKDMLDNHRVLAMWIRLQTMMNNYDAVMLGILKGIKAYETREYITESEYHDVIVVVAYNDANLKLIAKIYDSGYIDLNVKNACEGG